MLTGVPVLPPTLALEQAQAAEVGATSSFNCSYPEGQPWAAEPTTRASVSASGTSITDSYAFDPSVSADGRFVSYTSHSSQHVAGDTNGQSDVFVHDRQAKTTERVSVGPAGEQGNDDSYDSAISADGRYVAFTSQANSLLGGDPDDAAGFNHSSFSDSGVTLPSGFADFSGGLTIEAWVRPTVVRSWARVVDLGRGQEADNIVFAREGTTNNLIFQVHKGGVIVGEVRAVGVLELDRWQHLAVTLSTGGVTRIYKNGAQVASGTSQLPAIVTRTRNYIAHSNWSIDDDFSGSLDEVAIYRSALSSSQVAGHYQARFSGYAAAVRGTTPMGWWRLGDPSSSSQAADSSGNALHGTYLPTGSPGLDGALTPDSNNSSDVFVHDRVTDQTTRMSVTTGGDESPPTSFGNTTAFTGGKGPAISGDGRFVSFNESMALASADTNGNLDIYLRDRDTDGDGVFDEAGQVSTEQVSLSSSEAQGENSQNPDMSPDARYVTFTSFHPFVSTDTNDAADIYLRDRVAGTTTLITRSTSGGPANNHSHRATVSADGRYTAFESGASNLVSSDTNGVYDVFVRDRVAGTTTRASVGPSGEQANAESAVATLSSDGRRVVWTSKATNLVPGDTNDRQDVFVRDLRAPDAAKATSRASLTRNNAQSSGTARTYSSGDVSGDGRYVAFGSDGGDLVEGDDNGFTDVFVRDLGASDGFDLSPTLGLAPVAQSDEVGLEQFAPYAGTDLGTGTA